MSGGIRCRKGETSLEKQALGNKEERDLKRRTVNDESADHAALTKTSHHVVA